MYNYVDDIIELLHASKLGFFYWWFVFCTLVNGCIMYSMQMTS